MIMFYSWKIQGKCEETKTKRKKKEEKIERKLKIDSKSINYFIYFIKFILLFFFHYFKIK